MNSTLLTICHVFYKKKKKKEKTKCHVPLPRDSAIIGLNIQPYDCSKLEHQNNLEGIVGIYSQLLENSHGIYEKDMEAMC